jgi:hypothetical protein
MNDKEMIMTTTFTISQSHYQRMPNTGVTYGFNILQALKAEFIIHSD